MKMASCPLLFWRQISTSVQLSFFCQVFCPMKMYLPTSSTALGSVLVKNMPGGRPKKRKNNLALFNEKRRRERQNVTANKTASVDADQSHPASASENTRKAWAARRRNLQASSTRASQRTRFSRDMYVAEPAIDERISESAKRREENRRIKRQKQAKSAEEKLKTQDRERLVTVPMSGLTAGMVQYCAETMQEALVLSVRVFGVTAAQVHQAEQQCAERGEVVTVLEEVLTFPQKQDERVRPALEVLRREQHAMLGPLRQHHEHAEMQIWRR